MRRHLWFGTLLLALDQVKMTRVSFENAQKREEDLRTQLAEVQAKLADPTLQRQVEGRLEEVSDQLTTIEDPARLWRESHNLVVRVKR